MSWGRFSDTINGSAEFMKADQLGAENEDPRLKPELVGWMTILFMSSAQQKTDYVIERARAASLMGTQMNRVIEQLKYIGVIVDEFVEDGETKYRLVDKPDTLVHLVKKADEKMRRKRERDKNNPNLVVPVLLRDGSSCRWCGTDVNWEDTRSGARGTFDHLEPDKKTTVDNYVVACQSCNRERAAEQCPGEEFELNDPPEEPLYDQKLRKKLRRWPDKVSAVARGLGIPNPLTDEVEPRSHSPQAKTAGAVESTMNAGSSQGPSARPAEVSDPRTDRQQPADRHQSANAPGPLSADSGAAGEGGVGGGRKRRKKRRRHHR